MDLESLLPTRIALNDLKVTDAAGAFQHVAEALAAATIIASADVTFVADAFVDREKKGSTALGFGMAVPHIFFERVATPHLVVAKLGTTVDFRAVDGRPVNLLFCLISPESARPAYLHILGSVARVARDKDWRRYIERSATAGQVYDALIKGDKSLAR